MPAPTQATRERIASIQLISVDDTVDGCVKFVAV